MISEAPLSEHLTPAAVTKESASRVSPTCCQGPGLATETCTAVDATSGATVRSMCLDYLGNTVTPVLMTVQQDQERLHAQMEVSTKGMLSRMHELEVMMHQKADTTTVNLLMVRKAEAKTMPSLAGLSVWQQQTDVKVAELAALVNRQADEKVVCSGDASSASQQPDVRKVQVVIAAAGARLDRQLNELRKQVNELRNNAFGVGDRWPGRLLDLSSAPPSLPAGSRSPSDVTETGTIGSLTGSMWEGAEEREELKKIQAVVGAAGTVFSRDLRDVRKQLQELREDLKSLKHGDRFKTATTCGSSPATTRSTTCNSEGIRYEVRAGPGL